MSSLIERGVPSVLERARLDVSFSETPNTVVHSFKHTCPLPGKFIVSTFVRNFFKCALVVDNTITFGKKTLQR